METIAKIRRDYHVKKKGIKRISRERCVARNTVRKVIREDEVEFRYERKKPCNSKLDAYRQDLEELLSNNAALPVRSRATVLQIFQELSARGYEGSYESVCRHARKWTDQQSSGLSKAHVPLEFDPGEAYQFDWSQERASIDGEVFRLKVAQMLLCYSRMPYVRAYRRESQEMMFDVHNRAFAHFGGACERGIYDNLKTAVDRIGKGRERKINRRFLQMCSHHLVKPVACTPAAGWEKGRVEKQVQDLRRVLFTPQRSFEHLEECNQWLSDQCVHHAKTHAHPEFPQRKIFEVFECEREFLIPYAGAFDGFRSSQVRVSKTCLVRFDNNSYSVSAQVAGQSVEVYGYAERVVIRKDGEVVGDHKRLFGKGNTAYDAWHYVPVLTRKPGALRNGAPFRNWALPEPVQMVRERLSGYDDGDRQMVKILCAAMHHGLDAVTVACSEALSMGTCHADVVLNIVSRQGECATVESIEPPSRLRLRELPQADCERYDRLRGLADGP